MALFHFERRVFLLSGLYLDFLLVSQQPMGLSLKNATPVPVGGPTPERAMERRLSFHCFGCAFTTFRDECPPKTESAEGLSSNAHTYGLDDVRHVFVPNCSWKENPKSLICLASEGFAKSECPWPWSRSRSECPFFPTTHNYSTCHDIPSGIILHIIAYYGSIFTVTYYDIHDIHC